MSSSAAGLSSKEAMAGGGSNNGTGNRPQTQVVLLWREFLTGVKQRNRLIAQIISLGNEPLCPPDAIKQLMVELRQLSIKIIEDALEIEYRSQFGETRPPVKGGAAVQLPSIDKFSNLEKKEDVLLLSSMISDLDPVFSVPAVRSLLPPSFPVARNPFMLSRTVDELAQFAIPQVQLGNTEQEVKVLEFMRYKRAAKALLKAEAQVENKMPILLEDLEKMWFLKEKDIEMNILLRIVATVLDERNHLRTIDSGSNTNIALLQGAEFIKEPSDILRGLTKYRSGVRLCADVQAACRQAFQKCNVSGYSDVATVYLIEWICVVLGVHYPQRPTSSGRGSSATQSTGRDRSPNRDRGDFDSAGGDQRASDSRNKPRQRLESIPERTSPPEVSRTTDDIRMKTPERDASKPIRVPESAPPEIMTKQQKSKTMLSPTPQQTTEKKAAPRPRAAGSKKGNSNSGQNSEELEHLKYELMKMQQELLRRKVLDPRHYGSGLVSKNGRADNSSYMPSMSVDDLSVAGSDSKDFKSSRSLIKRSKLSDPVLICSRMIHMANYDGSIDVFLSPLTDLLHVVFTPEQIMKLRRDSSNEEAGDLDSLASESVRPRVHMRYEMKVTKLSINRLIGKQVDSILEADMDSKVRLLTPLFDKFIECLPREDVFAEDSDIHKARVEAAGNAVGGETTVNFALSINRSLHSETMTSGGVALNVIVARDTDCTGLVVECTPLPGALKLKDGKWDLGPVTLFIHDKELQVLLINQRGLFKLAQLKWSCMEMVAQWVVSRLQAKRVPIFNAKKTIKRLPDESTAVAGTDRSNGDSAETQSDTLVEKAGESSPGKTMTLSAESFAEAQESLDYSPMLLEVDIDRSVEVPNEILAVWRARNAPNLTGAEYFIKAHQDMEMLYFNVHVRLPDAETRSSLDRIQAERKKVLDAISKRKRGGLRIYTMYDEDEEFVEDEKEYSLSAEEILADNAKYVEVPFTFGLMGIELLIFGSIEMLEDVHKSTAIKSRKALQEGTKFMRNILGRLTVQFKGSSTNMYDPAINVVDKSSWELKYDRRLFRDVRTISGGVVVITASVVGGEILFDAAPTDGSIFSKVGSKLFTEEEILNQVLEDGWPLDTLQPEHRTNLAYRILDTLKIIPEGDFHRLESINFAESRMLTIARGKTANTDEVILGMVEINEHHTLSDLRILINHELDRNVVPKKFLFLYKGAQCAQQQEPMRRAWECLPKCYLKALMAAPGDERMLREASKAAAAAAAAKDSQTADGSDEKTKKAANSLAMRTMAALVRLNKKLSPVPVPTLCRLYEHKNVVYILHKMGEVGLAPGDVIRIGSIEGHDYVIPMKRGVGRGFYEHRKFQIEPRFAPRDDTMLSGVFMTLPENMELFEFLVPTRFKRGVDYESLEEASVAEPVADVSAVKALPSAKLIKIKEREQKQSTLTLPDGSEQPPAVEEDTEMDIEDDGEAGRLFIDLWVWKCIPKGEDTRPLYQRLYDNGQVPYVFKHSHDVRRGLKNFRIFISWKTLELMCVDARCKSLTEHYQRVDEMAKFDINYLVDFIFTKMCEWEPAAIHSQVIDLAKFQKLIDQAKVFSDYHLTARQYQLERLYDREYEGPNSIDHKGITKMGFWNLIRDVAFLRFPSTTGDDEDPFDAVIGPPPMMPGRGNRKKGGTEKKGGSKQKSTSDLPREAKKQKQGDAKDDDANSIQAAKSIDSLDGAKDIAKQDSTAIGVAESHSVDEGPSIHLNKDDMSLYSNDDNSSIASDADKRKHQEPIAPVSTEVSVITAKPSEVLNVKPQDSLAKSIPSTNAKKKGGNTKKHKISALINTAGLTADELNQQIAEYDHGVPRVRRTPQEEEHDSIVTLRLVHDYLLNVGEWYSTLWDTAKKNAMTLEARRYSAAARIQAIGRGCMRRKPYRKFRWALIILQANFKRRCQRRKFVKLMNRLVDDYIVRMRYEAAIRIQSSIRLYNTRCSWLKHVRKMKEQEVILMKARRSRFRKIRQKEKKAVIFREIRRLNGVPIVIIIKRKDVRNYSNDFGIIVQVYIPDTQTNVLFTIEEPDFRKFMQEAINAEALSIGDLLDIRHISAMIGKRLLLRPSKIRSIPHKITLSRQSLGQRGSKKMVKGISIGSEYFVCTVYSSGMDIEVSCYHRLTCNVFRCSISMLTVRDWIMSLFHKRLRLEANEKEQKTLKEKPEEQSKIPLQTLRNTRGKGIAVRVTRNLPEEDVSKIEPDILKPENIKQLYSWLLHNLRIDKRHGQFKVLFMIQLEKSKKMESIVRIQALWRRAIIRNWIPYMLDSIYLKVNTALYDDQHYFINLRTGESKWEKSFLLKTWELPTPVLYRWVELPYAKPEDLFVNPLTGRYTHMSIHRAAKRIQSLARNWFLRPYLRFMDVSAVKKCVELVRTAKSKYDADASKLINIVNYGLFAFAIKKDDRLSRQILGTAIELADSNPSISRLFGVFMLSVCEAPLVSSRERALGMMREAQLRDSDGKKFVAFRQCFKFACLMKPNDPIGILNLALVEYYIYDNKKDAETLIRRAVAISAFDERVVENWKPIKDSFEEKTMLFRPKNQIEKLKASTAGKGNKRIVVHGRDCRYDSSWAGWVYALNNAATLDAAISREYWYNPATGEETFEVPNFEAEWQKRVNRSYCESDTNGLEVYYDPITSEYFQRHPLSGTFS